jgi:hypothetical protein
MLSQLVLHALDGGRGAVPSNFTDFDFDFDLIHVDFGFRF